MRVLTHVKECADLRHFGKHDFLEKNVKGEGMGYSVCE